MESGQNEDIHGRISRVLDALLEISEAEVVLQGRASSLLADRSRIDALLLAIESNTSELHELIVIRKDKDNSKDSGNTSLTEVCIVSLFVSPCPRECNFQSETKIGPDLRL